MLRAQNCAVIFRRMTQIFSSEGNKRKGPQEPILVFENPTRKDTDIENQSGQNIEKNNTWYDLKY